MKLWKPNGNALVEIQAKQIESEKRLEDWIANDLSLLGIDAILIGQQVRTDYGGVIDILAIDRQGNLIIVEVKRAQTPREVIAQALDYASWVSELTAEDVERIFAYLRGFSRREAFQKSFDAPLPDRLNDGHSIFIVAGSIDPASRRIVEYLFNEGGLSINTAFFSLFDIEGREVVGTEWLLDQEEVVEKSAQRRRTKWSGAWYFNVGPDPNASWDDNREFGYIGAGGAPTYSKPLFRMQPGSRFFAYRKSVKGYVGYGEVIGAPQLPSVAEIGSRPFLDLPIKLGTFPNNANDTDLANYVVPVRWIKAVPESEAKRFPGIFANQHIVCRLSDERTIAFLKSEFALSDEDLPAN